MIVRYINTYQTMSFDITNTLIIQVLVCYTLNMLLHLLHFCINFVFIFNILVNFITAVIN